MLCAARRDTRKPGGHPANSRGSVPGHHRRCPGIAGMNSVALAIRQIWYINKSFIRNPASLFFTLVFPLMFLVIFTVVFGNGHVEIAPGRTVRVATFYVPAIAAFSVINACFTAIAITLSFSRDSGALKRIHGSPLPVWAYMSARIAHSVIMAIVLVVICAAFGALLYGATLPPSTLPAFALTLLVGAAA